MKYRHDQNFIMRWLRDLLCGFLIGAGAILPGVSGGVLAVVFDIYRPFMETLTHPRTAVPKYWKWLLPIGLGWCAGFLGFAKGIAAAMDIDTRIAHALVDIHAGVDTAEAFARAYGITLPDKENAGESRLAQVGEAKSTDANVPAEGTAVSARLPEQAVSVPTFLCNPRRGFWD